MQLKSVGILRPISQERFYYTISLKGCYNAELVPNTIIFDRYKLLLHYFGELVLDLRYSTILNNPVGASFSTISGNNRCLKNPPQRGQKFPIDTAAVRSVGSIVFVVDNRELDRTRTRMYCRHWSSTLNLTVTTDQTLSGESIEPNYN